MSKHVGISPEEIADRPAIREPIEAYARCADRRDATGQMALFTTDTHFVVYMNAKDPRAKKADLESSIDCDVSRLTEYLRMTPAPAGRFAPSEEALFLTNDPNALSGKHEESRVTGINPSSVSHLLDGVR
jgi:hypothetical protein